jgi:hypothetical protein
LKYTVVGNATSSTAAHTDTGNPAVSSVILEGGTSGSATVSASATGGTLNLGSTNATADASGNLIGASLSTGTNPPTNALGSGGSWAAGEGTATACAAATDVLWADSTAHAWKACINNGTAFMMAQAATGSNTATTCATGSVLTAISGVAAPTCTAITGVASNTSTLTSTTTTTPLVVSTYSVPGGSINAGTVFILDAAGTGSTSGTATNTFSINYGTAANNTDQALVSFSPATASNSSTPKAFTIHCMLTFYAPGAASTAASSASCTVLQSTATGVIAATSALGGPTQISTTLQTNSTQTLSFNYVGNATTTTGFTQALISLAKQ